MSICGTCGRQRDGDDQFCGGCGAEFSEDPATVDGPTAESATRVDGPSTPSDTFASWYQPPGGPRGGADAAGQYQPTQTVLPAQGPPAGHQAPPAQPAGYQPQPGGYQPSAAGYQPPQPGYPGSAPSPPGPPFGPGPPAGGPQRSGPRGLLIALAVVVVLAAGGGAYALATTLGKHSGAQPTISASPPAGGTSGPATTSPASSGPPPSPTPSPTLSLVAVGSGAGDVPPSVEEVLSHYFHGINFRDYAEYASTLDPAQRSSPSQSQSKFESGYSTTQDSGMTLTSLVTTSGAAGGLTATVTFTSRQSPGQSVDHSGCNAWTLNLYLVPQGAGYLIGPAPSGYAPDHSDC